MMGGEGLLTDWLNCPDEIKGLRFLEESRAWRFVSYSSLASEAHGVARYLEDQGVQSGDVVALVIGTSPSFVAALFGVWIAGGTVCSIAPQGLFEESRDYEKHIGRILEAAWPKVVLTDKGSVKSVGRAMRIAGLRGEPLPWGTLEGGGISGKRASLALLQFTSGSSGVPRGVKVSFDNLEANIAAMHTWVSMEPRDAVATWLPLFHDMGLIGCLMTPISMQCDVWIMRPDQFVRWPDEWLRCFGKEGATITAAPNFGYGYAARRIRQEELKGMDFHRWRVAIAGAEPINPKTLLEFADLLAPCGFRVETFVPAYGLAEATLSVTGQEVGECARAIRVDAKSLRFEEPVEIVSVSQLRSIRHESDSGWLVSCGRAHEGVKVAIVGDDGRELGEGQLGEIVIAGISVAEGYIREDDGRSTHFADGRVFSGDAGLLCDGELFVLGRIGDSIKVRGRSVYVEDLEAALIAGTGIGPGRCVVFACPDGSAGGVAAIGEDQDGEWGRAAEDVLRSAVGTEVEVRVFGAAKGTIRRTSSGKPRRRFMWELLSMGELNLTPLGVKRAAVLGK
jgi:acyl-CoA synthetase (AMP-forming)/AMP-acid ligase II